MKKLLLLLLVLPNIVFAAIKIDLYGDSTQAGAELINGSYVTSINTPALVLQQRMNIRFGVGQVLVRNKSIGGTTIVQQYFGQAPFTRTWAAEMAASDANIVIDNHGINDAFISYMRPIDYVWCHNQMSAEAQARGKKYYAETPNPLNNPANAKLVSFINALYAGPLYAGTNTLYVNNMVMNNWSYWIKQLPDGIHPNAEMYQFESNLLFYTLEPVVKIMLGV